MNKHLDSAEFAFCIHLIGMPGARRRPKVRMLLVATTGHSAVYEGSGSWSACARWIKRLHHMGIAKNDLAAAEEKLKRDQYATLRGLRVSLHDVESLGLQRVDR